MAEQYFSDNQFYKMDEDRNTLLSYMEVQIWFDSKMIESEQVDNDKIRIFPEQFLDISLKYLNKFINIYSSLTGVFWIRRMVKKDIFSFTYMLDDTDKNLEIIQIPFGEDNIINFASKPFELEQDKELRHHLIHSNYSWENDMVSMLNNSYKLGMYNIALTQLAILFENYIYTNLKKHLSNTKLDKIKRKEKCRCLVGISEICSRGINEHLKYDFGATPQWENIKNNLLKYRNLIVHGEQIEEISKEDYLKAQKAHQEAIKVLDKNVFS
jgi:hypothetical protein